MSTYRMAILRPTGSHARETRLSLVLLRKKRILGGGKYYWIGPDESQWIVEADTDYEAIREGIVSVTPLQRDQTDYKVLKSYLAGSAKVGRSQGH